MRSIEEDIEKRFEDLLDDPEFQKLAEDDVRFNVFDALGVRRQELRNSDFLAHILDPSRPHGLGDRFLRSFLLHSVKSRRIDDFLNSIELRLSSLDQVLVERERYRVDIVVENPGEWVVFIENKIDAGEADNQLARYKQLVDEKYQEMPSLLIYLTPNGDEPSEDGWLPISHSMICDIVSSLIDDEAVPSRVLHVLKDYVEYMRSYVLEDTHVADLCRSIYKKHRKSIDLILQHIPNAQEVSLEAAREVMRRLSEDGVVKLDASYRRVPRGVDVASYGLIPSVPGGSWTPECKGVLYEWEVTSKYLRVDLVVGPVDDALKEEIIKNLADIDSHLYGKAGYGARFSHISKEEVLRFDDIDEFMGADQFEVLVNKIEGDVKRIILAHSVNLRSALSGLKRSF